MTLKNLREINLGCGTKLFSRWFYTTPHDGRYGLHENNRLGPVSALVIYEGKPLEVSSEDAVISVDMGG